MPAKKARGLVIAERPINESDKLITIFSENGKFKAVARGARTPKSKIASASRLFAWSNFVYYPGKTFATLSEADLIDSFYSISDDLEKVSYASYCADLINSFYDEKQTDEAILKLAVYYFYYLAHSNASVLLLTLAFQLKLLAENGMIMDLDSLKELNYQNNAVYLSIEEGVFTKTYTPSKNNYQYKFNPKQIKLLLSLYKNPLNQIKEMELKESDRELVEKLIEAVNHFIESQLSGHLKSFEVIRQMREMSTL